MSDMTTADEQSASSEKRAWPLTWLCAVLPFLGFWAYGLFDLDEGFYGAVVSEMTRTGEWITPIFNGHPWFEKPILLYWLAKPFFMVFGTALGPRMPSVLATLGLFWLTARFVRKFLSDGAAQRTVLVLASSLLVVGAGRMMLVDPLLNLCFAGSLLFLWESLHGSTTARLWSGLLLGFSVLAKGPVGVILFGLIVGITLWREPEMRPKFRGSWTGFAILFVAGVAVWYVPAYLLDGKLFVQKFLVEQNLQRFTGGDAAHNVGLAGLPLYPLVLLVGMLPWSVFAFWAWPRGREDGEEGTLRRFLAAWALVVLIFFTLSGTKLPHYVLPACLPIAMLVGDWLARRAGAKAAVSPARLPGYVIAVLAIWAIAQGGFTYYYILSAAEVHQIAAYVRAQGPSSVAAYQMPRREKELGTMKPKIQETSHPSLVMYLDRNVLEAETFDQLLAAPKPLWIITRRGRIVEADVREAALHNQELRLVPLNYPGHNYELYHLDLDTSSRSLRH